MAPSQQIEKSAISITDVDTNMMVVLHIKKSSQNLKAYRKKVRLTVIFNNFQSCEPLILAKISGAERNLNLICNSS